MKPPWQHSLSLVTLSLSFLLCNLISRAEDLLTTGVMQKELGTFNYDELESYLYNVEVSSIPVVNLRSKEKSEEGQDKMQHDSEVNMILVSSHGQKFSCSAPDLQAMKSRLIKEEADGFDKFPNVSEILSVLAERDCLIKTVGWWTYEYCHGKFIRQYHLEAGLPIGKTLYMGFYSNETKWDREEIKQQQSGGVIPQTYHSVLYVNGTDCDITEAPRKTLVKISCGVSGVDRLAEVQEVDMCSYVVLIYTSLLCSLPFFRKVQHGNAHVIMCSPLISEKEYKTYLRRNKLWIGEEVDDDDELSKNEAVSSSQDQESINNSEEEKDTLELLKEKDKLNNNQHLRQLARKLADDGDGKKEGFVLEEALMEGDEEEQEILDQLELDSESLANLEEKVTSEVREKLSELGLPSEGVEVKLKVVHLLEQDRDSVADELEAENANNANAALETTKTTGKEKLDVKVIQMSLVAVAQGDDMTKKKMKAASSEAKEMTKMMNLEDAYNSVWNSDQDQQRKKPT